MFGIEAVPKTGLDYTLAGLAGVVVVGLVGLGLYGSFTGFLQTVAYLEAFEWVAVGTAVIGAGCVLYLMLELTGPVRGRLIFGACVIVALFSYFAVSKGIPAAATVLTGKPALVRFEIVGFDGGGRSCARSVVARNSGYEDFRQCAKYLDGAAPEIGRSIYVRGKASNWGIVREAVDVRL